MADEKEHSSLYPNPTAPPQPANGVHARSDAAAAPLHHDRELRRRKRNQCFLYVFLFVIFHVGVITLFTMTIMKVRTPRFRIRSATVADFNRGTAENPSFSGRLDIAFAVKNANFGRYKYRDTTVEFFYREAAVGRVSVSDARVGWRSTRRFSAAVDLRSPAGNGPGSRSELARDLRAGVLQLRTEAAMRGRVELIFVMKRKRSTKMNCTMEVVLDSQQVRNIFCK